MKHLLIILSSSLLAFGCSSSFDKEFNKIQPIELGDALTSIDTLTNCKKNWVNDNVIRYHAIQNDPDHEHYEYRDRTKSYYRETLKDVFFNFCNKYDSISLKWQNHYDENQRLFSMIEVDTAYVKYNRENKLKIWVRFFAKEKIDKASFDFYYRSWYNYENSVEPDEWNTDRDHYRLDGRVFNDTLLVLHSPSEYFIKRYRSMGSKNIIRGQKRDEYELDYTTAYISLSNGERLRYTDMSKKPKAICINK